MATDIIARGMAAKSNMDVETHTNNNDIHVTASDKSNWDSKLDKNQGSENSGKVLGPNANGEVVPLNGYGFEYDEETKMLKYGTDPTTNLNQGIGLDDTLSKRGYAADAGAVGELKEDLSDVENLLVIETVGVNLFDGDFDESGYFNASGDQASSNLKRTSKYYPIEGKRYGVLCGYLSETVDTFTVFFYDADKNYIPSSAITFNNVTIKQNVIPDNAMYFRVYTRVSYTGNVTLSLTDVNTYVPYERVKKVKDKCISVENLDDDLQGIIKKDLGEKHTFIDGVSSDVLVGLYVLDNSYKPYRIVASAGQYRIGFKNASGTAIINGEDVASEYYSDKIQKFVDIHTNKVIAYYMLHYTGANYSVQSDTTYNCTSNAYSLDNNNPIIKEYFDREENLVLIGDSLFGLYGKNILESELATISDKKVYNCGFGGCRMAYSGDGTGTYDRLSFVNVADCIANEDFTSMESSMSKNQAYPYRLASLQEVDFTKPTTIFIDYVNNDITSDIPIGDVWGYGAEYNKQTLLGAFNYGISQILTKYPHIRIVQFTPAWRFINDISPSEYVNGISKHISEYRDAIINNADVCGISVFDYYRNGGRNKYNVGEYQADATHYNANGYVKFAELLKKVDESYLG